MLYHDAIYGPAFIDEPVLLELLDSGALDRLRGIYQGGISGLLQIAPDFSRYDHSVGVCLLLRLLGASLEEQVAGLLHDVSHTAFSHVADFLFQRADQSYHEELFEETLAGSDVPAILARHGYDWRAFLDESRFQLLEQPLPRLCADRLDYFFRDAVGFGSVSTADVAWFISCLLVHDGRLVVNHLDAARWAGWRFMQIDGRSWSDLREAALYRLTADAIRLAWEAGCVGEADLRGTDWPLWQKLQACADPAVAAVMADITPQTEFVLDEVAPDFTLVTKIRTIDPEIWGDGRLMRLSELDAEFAAARRAYLDRKDRPWPVRVVCAAPPGEAGISGDHLLPKEH